jgi:uncharacterized protein YkwD
LPDSRGRLYRNALAAVAALLIVQILAALPVAQAAPIPTNNTATVPAAAVAQAQDWLNRIVELTNQERAKRGLAPLTIDAALNNSAQAHSQDMADHDYFSHTGQNGSTAGQRITAGGFAPLWAYGENIAAGQPSADEVMQAWMNSAEHRDNILSPDYTHIGVGFAYNANTTYHWYWTQHFASHGPVQAQPPAQPAPQPTDVPPQPTAVPPQPTAVPLPTRIPTLAPPTATPVPPTPTPVPPTPFPTTTPQPGAPQSIAQGFIARVVELTNQERAKAGLQPLVLDAGLSNAAQAHSQDMASRNYFGHTGLDGSTVGQRLAAAGYSPLDWYGENIAAGQPTPEDVVAAWMSSPGHRANILQAQYHNIGVGYAYSASATYRHYWTQDFGSHGTTAPTPTPTPKPVVRWSQWRFLPIFRNTTIG